MRFMMMHRQSADEEAGIRPSPEFMAGMGRLMEDAHKSGVFEAGEGLKSSHSRARVNLTSGDPVVKRGPYAGSNELVTGYALIKTDSMDEAINCTSKFASLLPRPVEMEVGQICEPWDLGFGPRPEGQVKTRYLVLHMGESCPVPATGDHVDDTEAARKRDMEALIKEMKAADVLVATEGLEPSSGARRLTYKAGKRVSMIDGPFAESKELVAGFSIFNLESIDDAVAWADRFGALFPQIELDIRILE